MFLVWDFMRLRCVVYNYTFHNYVGSLVHIGLYIHIHHFIWVKKSSYVHCKDFIFLFYMHLYRIYTICTLINGPAHFYAY